MSVAVYSGTYIPILSALVHVQVIIKYSSTRVDDYIDLCHQLVVVRNAAGDGREGEQH